MYDGNTTGKQVANNSSKTMRSRSMYVSCDALGFRVTGLGAAHEGWYSVVNHCTQPIQTWVDVQPLPQTMAISKKDTKELCQKLTQHTTCMSGSKT